MAQLAADLPVAILAGGLATRLRPITEKMPKLLIEVAGEPFFSHQLRLLKKAGLTRLVLCVGHLGEMIVEQYGDGAKWGVQIDYSFDGPKLLGTGGALIQRAAEARRRFLCPLRRQLSANRLSRCRPQLSCLRQARPDDRLRKPRALRREQCLV